MVNDGPLELTYDEVLGLAKKANPSASVRINPDGNWELYIPTFTRPSTVLPAKLNGSPADKLVQEEGFDVLFEWAKNQTLHAPGYMEYLPLEGIAEYYNFNHKREVLYSKNKRELEERGVAPETAGFSAQVAISEQLSGEFMMLNLRWLPLV